MLYMGKEEIRIDMVRHHDPFIVYIVMNFKGCKINSYAAIQKGWTKV